MVQSRLHALNNALLSARVNLELLQGVVPAGDGRLYLERALAGIDRAALLTGAGPSPAPPVPPAKPAPAAPPQPSPLAGLAPVAKAKAQPLAGFTVLLCENDRSVRDLLGGLLRAEGANVSLANRVAEGRAQLAAHRFDLLVLDRGLADGDGLALVPEANGARILIVTGVRETGDGTADRAAEAAYPVLVKPFRIDAFRRAIVQALNG
jgi:CheY-like chemotaxis protein